MPLEIHNLVGAIGVVVLLGTYLLLQVNKLDARSLAYSMLNALGSGLILVSLTYDFNLPSVLIESSWLVISVIGAVVTLRDRARKKELPEPENDED
ncbi:MAG: hypothetical protein AAF483_21685 [Planctomycetota bacterium]